MGLGMGKEFFLQGWGRGLCITPKELPRSTHAHQRILDNPGNFNMNILSLIPRGR